MANMAARDLKREIEKAMRETFGHMAQVVAVKHDEKEEGRYKKAKDFKPGDLIRDKSHRTGEKFKHVARITQCSSPHHLHFEIQNGPTWCVPQEESYNTK